MMTWDTHSALEHAALAIKIERDRLFIRLDLGEDPDLTVAEADAGMAQLVADHLARCQEAGFDGAFMWRSVLDADEPTHEKVIEAASALHQDVQALAADAGITAADG